MLAVQKKIHFTYDFVKPGSVVTVDKKKNHFSFTVDGKTQTYDRSSTVILDVGNTLIKGVIDVHQLENGFGWKNERIVSTAKLLSTFPSFLSNIRSECEEVKIIVHSNPDFDCFISVYLVEYYLHNGEFPRFTKELVEYAELVDTGRLTINPNQVFTPYSITHVLSETVGRKKFNHYLDYQTAYLKRGLELIDYIFTRFAEMDDCERSMNSPVLFEENHPFQLEQQLIEEDYKKYQEDLQTICEKRRMRLHCLNGSNKEVDGLFWTDVPTCSLDRLWARADITSPSGTGYVFTFVPRAIHHTSADVLTKFSEDEMVLDKIKQTNQVIISVSGNSDLTLVGLGKLLEHEECKAEERIFGKERKEKWRTRNPEERRFREEGFDNCDPWYDGRNNQYQIVDAPRIGSLLTFQEIKDVVLNYTKPRVKRNHTRILYPFHFQSKKYHELGKSLSRHHMFKKVDHIENKELIQYFRPYIREYLFHSEQNHKGYSETFRTDCKLHLLLSEKEGEIKSVKKLEGNFEQKRNDLILVVGNISISLFRYGIGFVVIEPNLQNSGYKDELLLDFLLEMNKDLSEGKSSKEILAFAHQLLGDAATYIQEYDDGLMYADVTLNSTTHFEGAKQELLYKLCSQTKWNTSFNVDVKQTSASLERMYNEVNERTVMGFSKKGSVLLSFEPNLEKLSIEQQRDFQTEMEAERVNFQTRNYYTFLMVLHQRYGFMNFSKELSEIGFKNNLKKVANLREDLYEFIMQGWFSQITNDETGMDIYKKWTSVFETQTLHDEVLAQVSTIADYERSKKDSAFSYKFNLVSFLFLIITGVTGFFGMNIPYVNQSVNSDAVLFSFYAFFGMLGFWLLISGGYWIAMKIKGK